jgi:hypothetical protein
MDVAAALYLHEEELKRDQEREQRDREFWITMFGGDSPGGRAGAKFEGLLPPEFDVSREISW